MAGLGFEIKEVWAFVAVHGDGDEGVVATGSADGGMLPLIAADPARLASLRPIAEEIAAMTNTRIRLVKFTQREELEVIEP